MLRVFNDSLIFKSLKLFVKCLSIMVYNKPLKEYALLSVLGFNTMRFKLCFIETFLGYKVMVLK